MGSDSGKHYITGRGRDLGPERQIHAGEGGSRLDPSWLPPGAPDRSADVELSPLTSWETFRVCGLQLGQPLSHVPQELLRGMEVRIPGSSTVRDGVLYRIVDGHEIEVSFEEQLASLAESGGSFEPAPGVHVGVIGDRIRRFSIEAAALPVNRFPADSDDAVGVLFGPPDRVETSRECSVFVYERRGLTVSRPATGRGLHRVIVREAPAIATHLTPDDYAAAERGRIRLVDGRTITLRAIDQSFTYEGLLEGLPNTRMNENDIRWLMSKGRSSSLPVHLVPPVIDPIPRLEFMRQQPESLPAVECRARFHSSSPARDYSCDWSELVIVWFQSALALPIERSIIDHISTINWAAEAEDCMW